MKVKMILPALTEATSPFFRPIKYSLFPPLGLATLAAYLGTDDEIELQDEHVERLNLEDTPDLVVIQVYITSANRAYRLADDYRRRGAYVVLGGLHVTSLPEEAAAHAIEQRRREPPVAEQVVIEKVQVTARKTIDLGERGVDRLGVEGLAAFEERFLVAEVAHVRAAA